MEKLAVASTPMAERLVPKAVEKSVEMRGCRLKFADIGVERAVSYTHLTLPTKRIV